MYQVQTVDGVRLINGIEIVVDCGRARVTKPDGTRLFRGTHIECEEYCRTHVLLVRPIPVSE